MKTLVVEDDFTGRIFLQEILSQYGQVHIATNGEEAVVAFQEGLNSKEPYQLVCLDIMLPGMDGQSVLREIRKSESTAGEDYEVVKVIMTTSVGESSSVIESFREQCDAYIIKPFKGPKLLDQLEALELI